MWVKDHEEFYCEEKFDPYHKEKLMIWGAICKKGRFPLFVHKGKVN